jgi:hypothetical protein
VSDTLVARARRERRKLDASARKEYVARTYGTGAAAHLLSAIVHTMSQVTGRRHAILVPS